MNLSNINCLIVDDDPFMRDLLMDKLNTYIPEVKEINLASSGEEGISKIRLHKPDLIFLDVEMLDMTGFEMLGLLDEIKFETIFITSYSHYAIKAIRFNALDYLLKPIDLGELKKAITRYKSRKKGKASSNRLERALQNIQESNPAEQSLILRTQSGELQLLLKRIIRIEGDRNYSQIYLSNHKKHLVSKTLGELEELLDDKGFFRCHKSHLVNYSHIQSIPNSYFLKLQDEVQIPISRRRKEEFKKWFKAH